MPAQPVPAQAYYSAGRGQPRAHNKQLRISETHDEVGALSLSDSLSYPSILAP